MDRPDVAWDHLQLYNYPEFATYLLSQECDLWIAPLADNHFNRCKSSVKFLEYSAHGAPGVYSRLEPYESLVIPGENGLLADSQEEWEQALAGLIENPDLRYELSVRAQMTVEQGWLLSQHAHRWREVYIQASPRGAGAVSAPAKVLWQAARRADAEREARIALEAQLPVGMAPKDLVDRLQQSEQARQASEGRLQEIYGSTAWKLVQAVWRLRLALAPKDSARERLERSAKDALRGETAATQLQPSVPTPAALQLEFSGDAAARLARGPQPGTYDLIVLPIMDWSSRRQRPQQLALQFAAAGQRVFYMRTSFRENLPPQVNPLGENLFEVVLPSPGPVNVYVDAMSAGLEARLLEAFKALQRHCGMTTAVILVDLPFWTPLALCLRDEFGWKVVYDCMDYHAGFTSNTAAMLSQEDRLVQESDLVLVTARSLLDRLHPQARLCLHLPNAADFQHFHNPPASPAKELEGLGKPVIGYYGAIADWFDTALVGELATRRPDWQFVLIGSTLYADLAPLQELGNVHLLGEMPYERLPQFLHAFDVAIIPFKPTPLTHATNPVKLFEYLSAGKPVAATALDELGHYQDYVRLASTPEEWLSALESALAEHAPEPAAGRVEFARQNTWQARFATLTQAINPMMVSSNQ
jgi:glycosyltransferase involved in cell wall biosynthesis